VSDEFQLRKAQERAVQAAAAARQCAAPRMHSMALEAAYSKELFLTAPEAALAREKLYLAVNVVRKVRDHLESVVSNGKLASTELKQLTDTAERKKRFGII
jgi:hypothetical protein